MTSPELALTVRLNTSAADLRRGVVRLHPEALAALGIREWDAIALMGARGTATVAGRAPTGTPAGTIDLAERQDALGQPFGYLGIAIRTMFHRSGIEHRHPTIDHSVADRVLDGEPVHRHTAERSGPPRVTDWSSALSRKLQM